MKSETYEGRQDHIRELDLPSIEAFENIYPDRDYTIHFVVPEFTCVCPKTGLPDFASFDIYYNPAKFCVELKSFKEYLLAYRNVGIFHENATNRISDDIIKAIDPTALRIVGKFNARGGISTNVERKYNWE